MTESRWRVAVIAGDGIGPEVIDAAVEVIEAAAEKTENRIEWVRLPWGSDFFLSHRRMMPEKGLDELRECDAIMLGAVGDPRVPDHVTLHGLLLPIRREFDQFLCLRPIRLHAGVTSRLRDVGTRGIDMVIVRENTEGEYADVGGRLYTGTAAEVAVQASVFTRRGCRRIMDAAFEIAATRRRHVTSVTKSNAQAYGMVLWDEVFQEASAAYPDIATRSLLVDAAAMEMVRDPGSFDVIVASNLFGDILSDLGAAIVGGLGLAPSGNINPARTAPSMFEPVHGSAPDIAGQGIANPVGTTLAAAMMLDHLGSRATADVLRSAVDSVLAPGGPRTADLGGTARTSDMTRELIHALH